MHIASVCTHAYSHSTRMLVYRLMCLKCTCELIARWSKVQARASIQHPLYEQTDTQYVFLRHVNMRMNNVRVVFV